MLNFTNIILRYGVAGSTARVVGKTYLRFKDNSITDKEVFIKIIESRYQIFKYQTLKEELLKRTEYLTNLTDLTCSILQIEGALKTKKLNTSLLLEVVQVVGEELRKVGVPDAVVTN